MKIDITPVGKPRQTQSDRWKERPAVMRYRAFADELRLKYRGTLPEEVELNFHMPMPKSWSAKKKLEMNGKKHQQRPDIDNLIKAVLDALLENDQKVWYIKAHKVWSDKPQIIIDEIV